MKSRLILASFIIGIIILGNLSNVFAYDVKISVRPGSVEKKSVSLESGDRLNYGLSVNGGQNDDIILTISDPYGRILVGTYPVYSYLRSDLVADVPGKDGNKDDKSYSEKPPKKSFGKRCWHGDAWVREDNMEICSLCGKELGKLLEKGNKSLSSFSGSPKEKSKPVESQQSLDSFVTQ